MPEPFDVPATGAIEYQFIRVPTNFTEDKWVQMQRCGRQSAVVHHAIIVAEAPEYRGRERISSGLRPGMMAADLEPGQARLVRAGSTLTFQMHYSTNGKAAQDRTRIGLVFAKEPVTEKILGMQSMPPGLSIPPAPPITAWMASRPVRQDSKLVALRAHMHLRGKSFQMRAVYPNGGVGNPAGYSKVSIQLQPYYYWKLPSPCRAHQDRVHRILRQLTE